MRNTKLILTVLLLIFTLSSTLMGVTAQPPAIEDVMVPVLQTPVTLDGILGVGEWSDAVELPVTFRFYNSTTPPYEIVANRTGVIYLKHDCVDLWTCIQIEDPIENLTIWDDYPSGFPSVMGDMVWIFYDVSEGGGYGGPGDDEKGVLHPDFTYDGAILPGPTYDQDTNLGGTKDIDGASGWATGWLTYEMVHPLNAQDAPGNDPSLYPGDEILAQFIVMDPEVDPMLYGMAMTEQWAYLLNLMTTRCPVGGEILPLNHLDLMAPYLLILVAALAGTAGILYTRRTP
jgi:hypothetical protein